MNFFKNKNFIILVISLFIVAIISIYFFTKDSEFATLNTSEFYTNTLSENSTNPQIIIHITGEILHPGIIYLNNNARIADAIAIAGGCTEFADLNKVNLAYELKDGQKIYIPSIYDEDVSSYISDNAGNNVLDTQNEIETTTININSATQGELETLPGVGSSTANKIIEYRNKNGKFKTIEDLKNVSRHW